MIRRIGSRLLCTPGQYVLASQEGKVKTLTLNRPKALNALCTPLVNELNERLQEADRDPDTHVIIVTGAGRAFAAGADIKEMAPLSYADVMSTKLFGALEHVKDVSKPIIAAVNGFALGGGCELAMMCDIILAGDKAVFGQPEILLGTIPGIGGTQRLSKAIGKSKAMEWVLTGDKYTAQQACDAGLVSRVVPQDQLMDEANVLANKIAAFSKPTVAIAKEAVNKAFELGVTEGLAFEKRAFQSTFGLADRKEGMAAFAEKRKADFKHQ